MKKLIYLLVALAQVMVLQAQVITKEITSKVTDVTVFMNAAQITHKADVMLEKGEYNLVFTGISHNIDQKSIQVSANNDVKITSFTYIVDYMNSEAENPVIKSLKDSLKLLTKKLKAIDDQLGVYENERALILKNDDLKGTTGGVSAELLKTADFLFARMNEINSATEKLGEQQESYNDMYFKIQNQLAELNSKQNQPVYKLSVTVNAKSEINCPFVIKYLVSNAGWAAFYDIRATDVNSPIQLDYNAKVYNNCGIDWKNVKLTLSTADPTQTAQRPSLTTWGLNYSYDVTDESKEGLVNAESVTNSWIAADSIIVKGKEKQWNNQFTTIQVSELSVDFDITTPYSIPSDNKVYFVDIQTENLPATYKYIAVPKVDESAFLVANITGWERLNLIEGNANIFYAGTFIGQSYINTSFANDTLEISLGRDKKVAVHRAKKVDNSGKTFIGGNLKESLSYEINVRNNNTTPIEMEVEDQVPVSQQDEIKVNVQESSGATPDPLNGKLVYNFKLDPSANKTIVITFSVQYPKAKAEHINLKKTRTIACPSFL